MKRVLALGLGIVMGVLMAGAAALAADDASKIRFGGDIRIREEAFDNIPVKADPPGVARGGENNYFRFRPRLWTEIDPMQDVTLRARLVDEFRIWDTPSTTGKRGVKTYQYPDEFVFDNLYLDVRNLVDKQLDLRIGRQELNYGTGKVILEGTPKDGSRTLYFDAVKLVWKGFKDNTIDLFGIYNKPKDDLALRSRDRELTGYLSGDHMTESGMGAYLKNNHWKQMPFEAYVIYKHESETDQAVKPDATGKFKAPALAWQTLNEAAGVIENPPLNLFTEGIRLMPVFCDSLKGNLELAYQIGNRDEIDVNAYMADAFLTYSVPAMKEWKPSVDAGVYCLSADDPGSKGDEGWNALWARYPQFSELYVYAWDTEGAGKWSNLTAPHVNLTFSPMKNVKAYGAVTYLLAPEKDGPGGGAERGWLEQAKVEFTLAEKLCLPKDKLSGHLLIDVLEPGNYYKVNDTAYFARWQMTYEF